MVVDSVEMLSFRSSVTDERFENFSPRSSSWSIKSMAHPSASSLKYSGVSMNELERVGMMSMAIVPMVMVPMMIAV